MRRSYCDTCQSAGAVNRWGFCEICGAEYAKHTKHEDFTDFNYAEALPSRVAGDEFVVYGVKSEEETISVSQDAA